MPKAIALCTPVTDYLVHVDHIPAPDSGASLLEHSFQYGGNAATAIVTVARQGVSAGIIGNVGDDDNGIAQRVDFQRHGVDTRYLTAREGKETPYVICLSDEKTNGRSFLGKRTDNRISPYPEEELDMEYLLSADYLLLDSNTPATRKAAAAMKAKGGEVMFDASSYSETQEAMLEYVTIYITSEFYWKTRYGERDLFECCRDMMQKGPHTVIFTLGADGCAGVGPQGEFRLPAFKVPHVVDTTGCGDTFHGAYIVGLERGLEPKECARWASATSAIKCCTIGGRAGQPTADIVEKFLATGEMDLSFVSERLAYYSRVHYQLGEK